MQACHLQIRRLDPDPKKCCPKLCLEITVPGRYTSGFKLQAGVAKSMSYNDDFSRMFCEVVSRVSGLGV